MKERFYYKLLDKLQILSLFVSRWVENRRWSVSYARFRGGGAVTSPSKSAPEWYIGKQISMRLWINSKSEMLKMYRASMHQFVLLGNTHDEKLLTEDTTTFRLWVYKNQILFSRGIVGLLGYVTLYTYSVNFPCPLYEFIQLNKMFLWNFIRPPVEQCGEVEINPKVESPQPILKLNTFRKETWKFTAQIFTGKPKIRPSAPYAPGRANRPLALCKCIPFESLNLKMKVNNVDDLGENWQANVSCQPAYLHKNLHI